MCCRQEKATLKCAVLSRNTMPQMSQVLRERAIGMLTAGMSTSGFFTCLELLRRDTRTADETVGLHIQTISAQTVRNHLREARRPHQGLNLTAV